MGQLLNMKADGLGQLVSCISMFEVASVNILDVGEAPLDSGCINSFAASCLLVLEDQHRATLAERFNQLQPVFEAVVLHRMAAVASVVHQYVERTLGEKKLMGSVINLLAAKVPYVEMKGPLWGIDKGMAVDVDAFGGFLFCRH
ncbi:MAG: hypothetical protein LW834_16435, partial [Cyanobium sp. 49614_E6]|nr:hypothetical protein [Cyanobium sp. 49614_E6]